MDGNGRWAKAHGLPRTAGHKVGADRLREMVKAAKLSGVKVLTVFAFSTENWARPFKEVAFLFSYMARFLSAHSGELVKQGIRFRLVGRRDRIDKKALKTFEQIEKKTAGNTGLDFNVAIDYGGRWDITQAAVKLVQDCLKAKLVPEDIDEKAFGSYLALAGTPEPDLFIRTSGEKRISNFLLWDLAYSEFYFTDVHWPDFGSAEFDKALADFDKRQRRFGAV
jgi:undecaprenyl diphosphate synthase